MSYDPFARGAFPVGVRTIDARDAARDRVFPCEIWYPAHSQARDARPPPGDAPLILYSHPSASQRRAATFLCTHLASHGYVVAAMDHSELVAPELRRRDGESAQDRARRIEALIASRVPDIRFLLDHLLRGAAIAPGIGVDAGRIGIVGHSFGGWTALSAGQADARIRAVVALAPGGASRPRPGILPLRLAFDARRALPTLYLVAEDDTSLPLAGMLEILERTPAPRRMVILRRADHCHFMDNVVEAHEAFRAFPATGDFEWIREMKPIGELCDAGQAHLFARGLTVCHFDAVLREQGGALEMLRGDLAAELARRGVDAALREA